MLEADGAGGGGCRICSAVIGNASARLSHLQREKVTKHINEALMPIVQQEENFKDAPPQLFGPDFA